MSLEVWVASTNHYSCSQIRGKMLGRTIDMGNKVDPSVQTNIHRV